MTLSQDGEPNRAVRLWPGVVIVALLWLIRFGLPIVAPDWIIYAFLGAAVGAVLTVVWWAFFSRVPHLERWGAFAVIALALAGTRPILDPSIAGGGMGMMFWILVVPGVCLALVLSAMAMRLSPAMRRAAVVITIFGASGFWALMRTDGIMGRGSSLLAWRWSKTAEQMLLSQISNEPVVPVAAPAPSAAPVEAPAATPVALHKTVPVPRKPHATAEWPGFRGPNRDDVVTGVRIKTDWAATPPVEMWRRPVGPGWSSFAVGDGKIYTQEQRGDFEVVSCYQAATGKPVWVHRDAARFWESNAGPGPRSTPTLHEGFVYTLGATGILNALDAETGAVVWTRNAASDTGAKLPGWGYTGSPIVVDDVVIASTSGRLAGYDRNTGERRWTGPTDIGGSYSSPQLMTIGGTPHVVMMTNSGATSLSPADGKVLWKHPWKGETILQPALGSDGALLITTGDNATGLGTRRLAVSHGQDGWKAEEMWTSKGLKPYFNDIVIHKGHAYGFDGAILSCIDLQDGKRKWKGGRYGNGQLLLLADQDLLLVVSEEGELALVSATPDQFTEMAKAPAIEGKTWNHPVVVHDMLLVRNGKEMAAFRLPQSGL